MDGVRLTRAELIRSTAAAIVGSRLGLISAGAAGLGVAGLGGAAGGAGIAGSLLVSQDQDAQEAEVQAIDLDDLRSYCKVAGLDFTDEELGVLLNEVRSAPARYQAIREAATDYDRVPAEAFRVNTPVPTGRGSVLAGRVTRRIPSDPTDIAYSTVAELSHWIHSGQITSSELTRLYLDRVDEFGDRLKSLVTSMRGRALRESSERDRELARGQSRGPLHGIPYGIKDLFDADGYPTQWGTAAFRGRREDRDAWVVQKLEEAGAVPIAKLSLGALAMNDVWFGGRTVNPWRPDQGSSGSSAGSASAVASGLVPFAIGTETSGSIVSPCWQCRVTGFRPTFGSVGRSGAMALSWTMDKVGPIAKSAEDCALVFDALRGHDPSDISSVDRPFGYRGSERLEGWRIGHVGSADTPYVKKLQELGATLEPVTMPRVAPGLFAILSCEAATMFDAMTADGTINEVTENEWPRIFRGARFVPAVEFLQATRERARLMEAFDEVIREYDAIVLDGRGDALIYPLNLTGHPQVLVPFGLGEEDRFLTFSLIGRHWDEGRILQAAWAVQQETGWYRERPDESAWPSS